MSSKSLTNLRKQIDDIDKQVVALLNKRAATARQIGAVKQGEITYRPEREAQVLHNIQYASSGDIPEDSLNIIYREIISACRNVQQPLRIAYLGPEGTYTEEAALKHFGQSSQYLPMPTIDKAIWAAEVGQADIAVVPVENSTEGSVARTLDVLTSTALTICDEILLPIQHNLLAKAGAMEDITEVLAHPQALAQCRQWLCEHLPHVKQTVAASNAEAARQAASSAGVAAIASKRASQLYDLPVVAQNIADDPANTTRFLALGTNAPAPTGADETSLLCSTPNTPGALHKVLAILAEQNINIVKLESRPAPGVIWDYLFYIDIDGHQADKPVAEALESLCQVASIVKVLGSYPKGKS